MNYRYKAKILRVVDADTFDIELSLGLDVYKVERVRLFGVNAPETFGVKKDSEEYKAGQTAKFFVKDELMDAGNVVVVETIKDKKGKYGRYLAKIAYTKYHDMKTYDLADRLLEKDLAVKY